MGLWVLFVRASNGNIFTRQTMIANGFDMGLSVYGVLEGEKMDKLEYALYRAKGIGKTDCSKWYEGFYSMQTDFPYGKSMNACLLYTSPSPRDS